MAAISHVFTIRRAAQILGRDEDLLWELSDQLEPEDGKLWVYDIDALKPPPSPTMASRRFAKLSRIRSIAPVNLKTSVPRCSAYAYADWGRVVVYLVEGRQPTFPAHAASSSYFVRPRFTICGGRFRPVRGYFNRDSPDRNTDLFHLPAAYGDCRSAIGDRQGGMAWSRRCSRCIHRPRSDDRSTPATVGLGGTGLCDWRCGLPNRHSIGDAISATGRRSAAHDVVLNIIIDRDPRSSGLTNLELAGTRYPNGLGSTHCRQRWNHDFCVSAVRID
jgi:hypothetical protein